MRLYDYYIPLRIKMKQKEAFQLRKIFVMSREALIFPNLIVIFAISGRA